MHHLPSPPFQARQDKRAVRPISTEGSAAGSRTALPQPGRPAWLGSARLGSPPAAPRSLPRGNAPAGSGTKLPSLLPFSLPSRGRSPSLRLPGAGRERTASARQLPAESRAAAAQPPTWACWQRSAAGRHPGKLCQILSYIHVYTHIYMHISSTCNKHNLPAHRREKQMLPPSPPTPPQKK